MPRVRGHAIKRLRVRQPIPDLEVGGMARRCDLCGKGPAVGHRISHAHNVTKRRWMPNLVSLRAVKAGGVQRMRICTRCLKAGKVTKAV